MNGTQLSGLLATSLVAIAPLPAIAQPLQFQCNEGSNFEARLERDKAKVRFASGETKTLLPVDSLVGRKFSDGRTLLFVNDTEAWIEVNYIKVHTECMAQQSPANVSSSQ